MILDTLNYKQGHLRGCLIKFSFSMRGHFKNGAFNESIMVNTISYVQTLQLF